MGSDDDNREQSAAVSLIQEGAELAGAAVGGAAGFVVGGPGGAAAGGAGGVLVTRALKRLGAEVSRWALGPLEEVRIGAAAAYAYDSINVRVLAGDVLRQDEPWREDDGRGRSAAEEVLEGVFRAAADSWEQRKVKYLGLLYASLAFRPDVRPGYANTLLRVAKALGYQQLELLAFFSRHAGDERLNYLDAQRAVKGRGPIPDGLSYELENLGDTGLVGIADASGEVSLAALTDQGPSIKAHQLYGTMALTAMGKDFHDLMRLDTMTSNAIEALWISLEASVGGPVTS